jgi:DNA-binding transcriptional MerR regulator
MADETKRLYYSISEVADMTGLKPHILRFWEGEFSMLRPRKNRAGNRAYTERDITIVKLIKNLLYEEKYTIEGAKKRLKSEKVPGDSQLSLQFNKTNKDVAEIRKELNKLIDMVDAL